MRKSRKSNADLIRKGMKKDQIEKNTAKDVFTTDADDRKQKSGKAKIVIWMVVAVVVISVVSFALSYATKENRALRAAGNASKSYQAGDYDKAYALYDKAYKIDAEAEGVAEGLSWACAKRADRLEQAGEYEKALKLLEKNIKRLGDNSLIVLRTKIYVDYNEFQGIHDWIPATCSQPKTCRNCGLTEGTTIPHTWMDATYSKPKTCSECGEMEGEPLVPYSVENGFGYAARLNAEVPFLIDNVMDDSPEVRHYNDAVVIPMDDAVYSLISGKKEVLGEEGITRVTLEYSIEMKSRHSVSADRYESAAYKYQYKPIGYGDIYSGRGMVMSMSDDNEAEGTMTIDLVDCFKDITVKTSRKISSDWTDWQEADNRNGDAPEADTILNYKGYVYYMDLDEKVIIQDVIEYPSDYDGLVLYIPKEGQTEFVDLLDGPEFGDIIGEGKKARDYFFVMLSDIAKQSWNTN